MREIMEVKGTMCDNKAKKVDFNTICYFVSSLGVLYMSVVACLF